MKQLPVDDAGGQNRVADEQVVQAELNAEETRRLLVEVPQAHHTQITEVLLAGLVQAVGEWTGERNVWPWKSRDTDAKKWWKVRTYRVRWAG